mgnify:CR=1 FL=1
MADYIRPVVFRLGDQEFGVDINLVQSIEKQVNVVPVPNLAILPSLNAQM